MKDRIKKVMDESGLSASKFADKIGVPRSGLSHVLSGRNKPSLDYVLKMLNAFPELDPNWLLKGQKSTTNFDQILDDKSTQNDVEFSNDLNTSIASVNKKMGGQADKMIRKISKVTAPTEIDEPIQSSVSKNGNQVERIVYFYSDGSFKEYFPKP